MSSMLTHFMSIFRLPRWADAGMDKFRMSFLWKGKNPSGVSGCNCLVNWKTCTRPKKWGGGGEESKILRSLGEPYGTGIGGTLATDIGNNCLG
jgi:hypothetical protein